MTITRPIVVLDLETTGTNPREVRIVSLAAIRTDFKDTDERHILVNPGRPIPPEATAVHGITDKDVYGRPTFAKYAKGILEFMDGCTIAGYNLRSFDLPMLHEELLRAGHRIDLQERLIIDPMVIFYREYPRTLAAAVKTYVGVEIDPEKAHDALFDARCARDILFAMMDSYSLQEMHDIGEEDRPVRLEEIDRWFEQTEHGLRFRIGKHKGKLLDEVAAGNDDTRGYLDWMLREVMDADVHGAIAMAQMSARGKRPPPQPTPEDEQRSLL